MKKHTPLVIGNWKMNPDTVAKSVALFTEIKKAVGSKKITVDVAIAAPFVSTAALERLAKKSQIALSAQDVFYETAGAYTGEVSVSMLKSVGVTSVIIGHSERRALGESEEVIGKKATAVLKNNLTAVVCVGERVRDTHGDYFNFVESQLKSVFAYVDPKFLARLIIAYEPVWAIGTQKHATPEDVQEMKLFIQKNIADTFGRSAVEKVRIIYGGSVSSENAQALLTVGGANGFLVGGASLKATEFAKIVGISNEHGNKKS